MLPHGSSHGLPLRQRSMSGPSSSGSSTARPRAAIHVRCRAARSVAAPATEDPAQVLANLAEECMNLVAMRPTALGRGLVLQQAVPKQALVSVPIENALVLSDDPLESISIFGDRAQRAWQEKHGELPSDLKDFLGSSERWDVRMTAWLLHILDSEGSRKGPRGGPSLWDQYLQLLPSEKEVCCLLNYGEEEAQELQLKELILEAKVQREWVAYLHDRWFSKRSGKGPRGLRLAEAVGETLWASAMVRSRTFSETISGEGLTLMVPFADLANHSFEHNSTFCVGKDRVSFELRSVQPIESGIEMLISYGETKTNPELMRDYGFVVPGNPNDRVALPGFDAFTATDPSAKTTSCPPKSKGGAGSAVGPPQGSQPQQRLPLLNGASLMQAAAMQGDWQKEELKPAGSAGGLTGADAARRRCALLSLPLTDGFGGIHGAPAALEAGKAAGGPSPPTTGSGGISFGSLFDWVPIPRAWTDAGAPPPRTLKASEVASERESVALYLSHLRGLLSQLPTTADQDVAILQEQRQLQQQQQSQASQQKGGAALISALAGKAGLKPQLYTDRQLAAVRCRLEHKQLVGQGVACLEVYEASLNSSVRLPGSQR